MHTVFFEKASLSRYFPQLFGVTISNTMMKWQLISHPLLAICRSVQFAIICGLTFEWTVAICAPCKKVAPLHCGKFMFGSWVFSQVADMPAMNFLKFYNTID
jgi:hypothetical protein